MYGASSGTQNDRTPDQQRRFGHRRRIRGTTYIWGSRGITADQHFQSPPILFLRNDLFGQPIKIHTEKADGTKKDIGTLEAGEYLSIPVQDIRGIAATCDLESTVSYILSGDLGDLRWLSLEPDQAVPSSRSDDF